MKSKDIPAICRNCNNLKKWNLKMDGSFSISCRKIPVTKMGDVCCKHKEEDKTMTKKEAVEILQRIEPFFVTEAREAMRVAISTLLTESIESKESTSNYIIYNHKLMNNLSELNWLFPKCKWAVENSNDIGYIKKRFRQLIRVIGDLFHVDGG